MIILGIETSCDETAVAVVRGSGEKIEVLSNVVSSQIEIHKKYGGVVPEVAAREHVLNILPVINEALEGVKKIDAIAVTTGPGLVTSLLVGVETAKTLAYAWKLPVAAVNHIEGHIYANWLPPIRNDKCQMSNVKNKIKFPAVVLTVSGGHTMLVLMKGHGKYKILGETRDDAAGEAFDKAAQLLEIGYPGGPAIAAEAAKFSIFPPSANLRRTSNFPPSGDKQFSNKSKIQNSKFKISLPRPMIRDKNFDFSFSGLKTSLLYALQKDQSWKKRIPEYAAEFQQAVIDVLVKKTIRAAETENCKNIMLSGGVAANIELRRQLKAAVETKLNGAKPIIPDLKYCTDNAAMIAAAGYFRAKKKDFMAWQKLKTDANLELK